MHTQYWLIPSHTSSREPFPCRNPPQDTLRKPPSLLLSRWPVFSPATTYHWHSSPPWCWLGCTHESAEYQSIPVQYAVCTKAIKVCAPQLLSPIMYSIDFWKSSSSYISPKAMIVPSSGTTVPALTCTYGDPLPTRHIPAFITTLYRIMQTTVHTYSFVILAYLVQIASKTVISRSYIG